MHILIVEDEPSQRETLQIILEKEGYTVSVRPDGTSGLEAIRSLDPDLVLSDIRMPECSGLDLLRIMHEEQRDCEIILLTAWANAEEAVEAMKMGAYDYLIKPYKTAELRILVEKALEKRALRRENKSLRQALSGSDKNFIFRSPIMKTLVSQLERAAPMDATVLLTGDSGVGKEVMAQFLWQHSNRCQQPFVAVNCGAIPENLVESELFGFRKGSFSGAVEDHEGLFEQAHHGVLFLDEIGELPLNTQVKLLRVLQERSVRKLGDTTSTDIDVRIIAATNRNLETMVAEGSFRKDLFYRINVFQFRIPPLRERQEDIVPLAEYFRQRFVQRYPEKSDFSFSSSDLSELDALDFPGNVRELENWVERRILFSEPSESGPDTALPDLALLRPLLHQAIDAGLPLADLLEQIEAAAYAQALQRSKGSKTEAANKLGLSFRQFRYRYNKLFPEENL